MSWEGGDVQLAIAAPAGSRGIRSCNMSQLLNATEIGLLVGGLLGPRNGAMKE